MKAEEGLPCFVMILYINGHNGSHHSAPGPLLDSLHVASVMHVFAMVVHKKKQLLCMASHNNRSSG